MLSLQLTAKKTEK